MTPLPQYAGLNNFSRLILGAGLIITAAACDGKYSASDPAVATKGDEDPYPARWIDESGVFAQRFGQVTFEAHAGNEVSALVYRGTGFDSSNGPIWFVMHGASRDVERYIRAAAPVAERHNAMAVAIHFTKEEYPAGDDYTLGVTTTGKAGAEALAEGRWRQPDTFLYAEIEHVFEAVRQSLRGQQRGYFLFGHSAGAQFAHRLVTFVPNARVLGAVAANAGWYTLPIRGADASFAMPYGLEGSPVEGQDHGVLFSVPLTILVGERDTTTSTTDPLVRGTAQALTQGTTRLARGYYYFETGRAEANALGVDFGWQIATVPRARHSAAEVMTSAGLFLFEPGKAPCEPSLAADATELTFSEILADPPSGIRGDANTDGVRNPLEDEFIEIVNNGAEPICLTGWALGDASDPERHVFTHGPYVQPGRALVVFGGGVPTGDFGDADVQWAAFGGNLNLSNDGDTVTLRDSSDDVVAQVSWGNCAGMQCAAEHWPENLDIEGSIVRWPEPDGDWAVHAEISESAFSPGVRVDGKRWQATM